MNAKEFQDLLKESKDILQEGYFDNDKNNKLSGFYNKSSKEDLGKIARQENERIKDQEEREKAASKKLSMADRLNKHRDKIDREEDVKMDTVMDKVIEKISNLKDAFENPEDLYDEVVSILGNAKDSIRDYMQSMEPNLNSVDPDVAEIIRAQRAKRAKRKQS